MHSLTILNFNIMNNLLYRIIHIISDLTALILVFVFITSCDDMVKEIDWETESIPPKIVVEGSITNQIGVHPIKLSVTDDYFSNHPEGKVLDAEVVVKTQSGSIAYVEDDEDRGTYYAQEPFAGDENVGYTLHIELATPIDGSRDFMAQSDLIEGMKIDTIEAFLYPSMGWGDEEEEEDENGEVTEQDSMIVVAVLYGKEPSNINNYYMAQIFRNGKPIHDLIQDNPHFQDIEYEMNGAEAFVMVIEENFEIGDTIGISLISITEEYNYFLTGLSHISQPEDPFGFSGPPANAVGNISNGGLGFFSCGHVSYSETIVDEVLEK